MLTGLHCVRDGAAGPPERAWTSADQIVGLDATSRHQRGDARGQLNRACTRAVHDSAGHRSWLSFPTANPKTRTEPHRRDAARSAEKIQNLENYRVMVHINFYHLSIKHACAFEPQ